MVRLLIGPVMVRLLIDPVRVRLLIGPVRVRLIIGPVRVRLFYTLKENKEESFKEIKRESTPSATSTVDPPCLHRYRANRQVPTSGTSEAATYMPSSLGT
jgi:hypothetical protein